MKLEMKHEVYSSCECCGDMVMEVVRLDGEEIYNGIIEDFAPYDFINEQVNQGVTHFAMIVVMDTMYDSYIQINDKLFKGYVIPQIINMAFEKYHISYDYHEVDLTFFRQK